MIYYFVLQKNAIFVNYLQYDYYWGQGQKSMSTTITIFFYSFHNYCCLAKKDNNNREKTKTFLTAFYKDMNNFVSVRILWWDFTWKINVGTFCSFFKFLLSMGIDQTGADCVIGGKSADTRCLQKQKQDLFTNNNNNDNYRTTLDTILWHKML